MCKFTDKELKEAYGVESRMDLAKVKLNIALGMRILKDLKTNKIPEHQKATMEEAAERYILNKPETKLHKSLRETIYFDRGPVDPNKQKDNKEKK